MNALLFVSLKLFLFYVYFILHNIYCLKAYKIKSNCVNYIFSYTITTDCKEEIIYISRHTHKYHSLCIIYMYIYIHVGNNLTSTMRSMWGNINAIFHFTNTNDEREVALTDRMAFTTGHKWPAPIWHGDDAAHRHCSSTWYTLCCRPSVVHPVGMETRI